MVNSKKNTKSIIALVVLSLLLIASICLAATGAWFTDKDATTQKNLTFGTLDITSVSEDVAVVNTVANESGPVMPGSHVKGNVTINYKGTAAAWYRYKVVFGGDGAGKLSGTSSEWVYGEFTGTGEAESKVVAVDVKVDESVDNTAQGLGITLNVSVECIQKANTAETAEEAFTKVTDANIVKYTPTPAGA